MSNELNTPTIRALRNLIANIDAGNANVDLFDVDNLSPETAQFNIIVTVPENKILDVNL